MVANTTPIWTDTPDLSTDNGTTMPQPITAAAADFIGTNANNRLTHTAGADGSYVRRLRFKSHGINVPTVARIYINNGSTPTTAANNWFYGEMGLPATTAPTTTPNPDIDYPMDLPLGPGDRIYVGLGAAVAAGWSVGAVAGQY